jgi:hypothetical protein
MGFIVAVDIVVVFILDLGSGLFGGFLQEGFTVSAGSW